MLDQTKTPRFTTEQTQQFARELYGIAATAEPLESYIDQNFLLRTEAGTCFVFKIANASEQQDLLDLQNQAMMHLHKNAPEITCPEILPSRNGNFTEAVTDAQGNTFQTRVLSYLPGKFLSEITPHSPDLLADFGKFLGKMDRAFTNFVHPAMQRYFDWDFHNALHMRKYTQHIKDSSLRRLAEYFYLQFESEVLPGFQQLPAQVIHNDANDYNVLSDGKRITGIIDFGDVIFTQRIAELSIACTYMMMGKTDPIAAAAAVVRAYHAVHPLQTAETDAIYFLVGARLAMSLSKSAAFKHQNPTNDYIAISEKMVMALIERLIEINPEYARRIFRNACHMPTPKTGRDSRSLLQSRREHIGKNLSISYRQPLRIVRGAMQYLFDNSGKTYLDCVNNVCHVGHCHPKVVRALHNQVARLNTNTRYLHENIVEYAEGLTATLPDHLSVCFFVNSGSEANDLALRLARNFTGQKDCIVIDAAYHGNLSSIIELSPYKFNGPGGAGCPETTQVVAMPDLYRGAYRRDDPEAALKYAAHVKNAIDAIHARGRRVAAFFAESLLGCGGQIVLPAGYLQAAFQHVRNAGGLCISDEVQVGFGRVGSHWWGFETQNAVPDIVTMGKPIGNGHPVAAVVTTSEIADAFANGMEYFNTFGGNPVSCAVGMAVLDVIEQEALRENAMEVGRHLLAQLRELQKKHALIGDVRGMGLFIGVELVSDRETLTPAANEASEIVNHMKKRGILLSTDGPLHNVIKIKPPLVINKINANRIVNELDDILDEF